MTIYLRPFEIETDLPRIAELMTSASATPTTAAQLAERERRAPCERIQWRVVAVESGGRIVGYGSTGRDPRMTLGRYWLQIVVDSAARHNGIGTMLYDDLQQFAWEQGANGFELEICDQESDGLRFVEHRGFFIERRYGNNCMLLRDFDAGRWASTGEAASVETYIPYFSLTALTAPAETDDPTHAPDSSLMLDMLCCGCCN